MVDFSAALDGPWWSVGALFRRMRDWMIGSQGLDTADKIIPEWQVAAVEDAARMPEPDVGFAAGISTPQENTVNEQEAAALKAENARLQAELTTARHAADLLAKNRIHDDNVAFAAALVTDPKGPRLAPQHQSRVVALLDALGGMQTEVEFSAPDGKPAKEAPGAALRAVLESAAVIVPGGAAAGGAVIGPVCLAADLAPGRCGAGVCRLRRGLHRCRVAVAVDRGRHQTDGLGRGRRRRCGHVGRRGRHRDRRRGRAAVINRQHSRRAGSRIRRAQPQHVGRPRQIEAFVVAGVGVGAIHAERHCLRAILDRKNTCGSIPTKDHIKVSLRVSESERFT